MQHPFEALQKEYHDLIASATILPVQERTLDTACNNLLKNEDVYQTLSDRLPNKIPTAFLMALSEREMSGNTHCYLGNGQSLSRKTTIVPKGRGPFLQSYPENFIVGGLDALHLDGLDKITDWSMERAAYEAEWWNGWGYRSHGIPSPYVFGATSVQRRGKYVSDGVYDASVMDPQLGVIAIIEELFKLKPSLQFADTIVKVEDAPSIVPALPPVGVGGGINVFLLQQKLNALHVNGTPLRVDGVYGRGTKRAVIAYQFTRKLLVDGLVGPQTIKALAKEPF